jgi:hypothetical protein
MFTNPFTMASKSTVVPLPELVGTDLDSIGASGNITMTYPGGVQNGDVMILFGMVDESGGFDSGTNNGPQNDSWATIRVETGSDTEVTAYRRAYDGTEGASETINFSGSGASYFAGLLVFRLVSFDTWSSGNGAGNPYQVNWTEDADSLEVFGIVLGDSGTVVLSTSITPGSLNGQTVENGTQGAAGIAWRFNTNLGSETLSFAHNGIEEGAYVKVRCSVGGKG